MQAIMTSTSAAARLLGLGQDIGAIAEGKQADLLFVEGNPLRNIGMLLRKERIVGVMQRGRFVAGALVGTESSQPCPLIGVRTGAPAPWQIR